MEPAQLLLLALAGVAAGFLNVMAGGGSLIAVPVMLFLGVPGPVANGTNRIAILAQSAAAVATFARRGHSDFRLGLSLAACAMPGALLGALLGARLEGEWFERAVALIMLGALLAMAVQRKPRPGARPAGARRRRLGHALMLGVGFWGGFIQIGVGFLIMPVLHRVMGLDLLRTNMHKVFIVACYTALALAAFASQVAILWSVGLALALGNAAGGWLAARLQIEAGDRLVRAVLYIVLPAFAIRLLFFS